MVPDSDRAELQKWGSVLGEESWSDAAGADRVTRRWRAPSCRDRTARLGTQRTVEPAGVVFSAVSVLCRRVDTRRPHRGRTRKVGPPQRTQRLSLKPFAEAFAPNSTQASTPVGVSRERPHKKGDTPRRDRARGVPGLCRRGPRALRSDLTSAPPVDRRLARHRQFVEAAPPVQGRQHRYPAGQRLAKPGNEVQHRAWGESKLSAPFTRPRCAIVLASRELRAPAAHPPLWLPGACRSK